MSDESAAVLAPPLNVFDYERLAKARMPGPLWDFVSAGADDEVTLSENRRAFERVMIRPRMLVDVERVDMTTTLLGDAGGLRPALAKYGITFTLFEESEVFGNVTGGYKRGADYDGVTTPTVMLDTSKAFGWEGGTINVSAWNIRGRSISTDNLLKKGLILSERTTATICARIEAIRINEEQAVLTRTFSDGALDRVA